MKKEKLKCMVPLGTGNLDELFKNKREADKARVILQHLFFIKMRMKKDPNFSPGVKRSTRYVPVSALNLKLMVRNYAEIIQQLIKFNIIEYKLNDKGNKSYWRGKLTMLYRIKNVVVDPITKRKYRVEYITHPAVLKAVERYYTKTFDRNIERVIDQDPWLESTVNFIDQLYIDITDEQIRALKSDKKFDVDYLTMYVDHFNNKMRRFIKRDNYSSRLHSHVSNIPKLIRPYLKLINGDTPLILVDIKSAQPYLLSVIFYHSHLINLVEEFKPILPIIVKYKNHPSLRLFFEDCAAGTFYSGLVEASGIEKDELKTLLFEHVFYSSIYPYKNDMEKGTMRWRIHQLFCSKYRGVFDLLNELKTLEESILPFVSKLTQSFATANILAARLETTILLDGITRQCAEEDIPVATIHDAWILKKVDYDRFEEVYLSEFKLLQVDPPQVEITPLSVQH